MNTQDTDLKFSVVTVASMSVWHMCAIIGLMVSSITSAWLGTDQ
jgi:hypothetical protein